MGTYTGEEEAPMLYLWHAHWPQMCGLPLCLIYPNIINPLLS